jgi:L-lactate dehydrogenase complex protein LldG
MSSKDAIMSRVWAAGCGGGVGREAAYAAIPRAYRSSGTLDSAGRLELFEDRLRDYGVNTLRCGANGVAEAVACLLPQRGTPGLLTPTGFPHDWLPAGFEFAPPDGLDYNAIDRAHGVITLCAVAVAFTGTIILLDSAPGQGKRELSLIPDYHLCVVDARQIVELVPEAIRAIDGQGTQGVTTISGPSATADIEMTRVRGVHGPRTLEVIIRVE